MSDDDLAEVISEFLVESQEGLDALDQAFVALESDPTDASNLGFVFRTIHSIKGASGFLGFQQLEKVTHAAESLLSLLRDGTLVLTPGITTTLLLAVDVVRQMLTEIEQHGNDGDGDHTELIARIAAHQRDENALAGAAREGAPEVVAEPTNSAADPPSPSPQALPVAEGDAVAPAVQVALAAQVGGDHRPVGEILVAAGVANSEDVHAALVAQEDGDPRPVGEILAERGAIADSEAPAPNAEAAPIGDGGDPAAGQRSAAANPSSSTIRIDVGLLDRLMNLVGELVLARNQVVQFTADQPDAALIETTQRLNLITTELQAGVMKTRMQPIGNVWSKFPRVVRDLSLACGKQVALQMEGSDTELDKTIIEAVKDPLTHLVRNAIDHGIELPEARAGAGKPAEGTLKLRAFHEGGHVNIEIFDDGGGIDPDKIRAKAVSNGLISAEQASRLSDRDAGLLIFLPGFSTATEVTNISGRGVGMDVVKTNIEKIGGAIDMQSTVGVGTTIRIKIPLTLAIIPALIVSADGERYLIPQVNLVELVRLEGGQTSESIETIQNVPVCRLRDRLLPLVTLSEALDTAKPPAVDDESDADSGSDASQPVSIVVLQADDTQFGVIVDEVLDTEEIVVKPLSRQIQSVQAFAGATIMGDGRVALIVDVMGLAQRARVINSDRQHQATDSRSTGGTVVGNDQAMLVMAVGSEGRVALPLATVDRLEEFERGTLEHAGGQPVVQYRDGIMPLLDLAQMFGAGTMSAEAPVVQVVVVTVNGKSVGLVCDEIIDIIREPVEMEHSAARPGSVGVAVIGGRVTEVLDIATLLPSTPEVDLVEVA